MKYLKEILITLSLLSSPVITFAAPTSWDFASGILQPLTSQRSAEVRANNYVGTSTTAINFFPQSLFTQASSTEFCLIGDTCITSWPTGGGGAEGVIGTTTPLVDTYVVYSTSASTIGNESTFTYDDATNKLTVTNASTTAFSSGYASSTSGYFGNLYATLPQGFTYIGSGNKFNSVASSSILLQDFGGAVTDVQIPSTIARDTELHNAVTLAGEDYLSLSTQQITANAIDPDNLSASDFGSFTCNGTTCTVDTGVISNTMLANSTISGIALGSNLANLTATDSTLTFSGTYNGGTARTIGLNLGNANTWTAKQTFSYASSTGFSSDYASSTVAHFGTLNLGSLSDGCLNITSGVVGSTGSACGSGGGSAGGTWSTTTSTVAGQDVNYSNNSDDIVAIGSNSTTTAEFYFDPNTGVASFGNGGASDSTLSFGPDTSNQWIMGYDATDKSFAIASSTALGTLNALKIDKGGLVSTSNATSTLFTATTAWVTNLFVGADTLAEYIADTAGAFFTGNTETGITVTYQDADNTVDVVCDTANGSTFGCLSSTDWTTFNNKLSSYNAWTNPLPTWSATTSALMVGTTTNPWASLTVSSSTKPQLSLSAGAGIAQWLFRNAGGNLYISTSTVAGTATTSISALEISGSGFGTTTVRGLNISGQATSTSNVGFNLTGGCFAINGTCIGGGSGGSQTTVTDARFRIYSGNRPQYYSQSGGNTLTAGTIYCSTSYSAQPGQINRIAAWHRTGGTGGKGSAVGIIDYSTGNFLATSTVVAASGQPQLYTLSTTVDIEQGTIYALCATNESGTTLDWNGIPVDSSTMSWENANSSAFFFTCGNAPTGTGASFAMPSSCGTKTASTDTNRNAGLTAMP